MKNIQETLENAGSVAFFLNKPLTESETLAVEALAHLLQDEKKIYFFPETPQEFKSKWSPVLPEKKTHDLLFNTSIHIPKDSFSIKEVSYDNNEKYFTINLSSGEKHLENKEVLFESKPTNIDMAFCIGENKNDNLSVLVSDEKIISLDNQEKSIPEFISDIIEIAKKQPLAGTQIPTLLLASLFSETDNLKNTSNPDQLILAGNLMKTGADEKAVKNITGEISSQTQVQVSSPQLLGRALARTQTNEALKSVWTFISSHDLQKTNNEEADHSLFYQLSSAVRNFVDPQPVFVLLWQNNKDEVYGMLTHYNDKQEAMAQRLLEDLEGQSQNGSFITGPYANFSEAEIKIQSALKKIV